jgi:hypothetical protein
MKKAKTLATTNLLSTFFHDNTISRAAGLSAPLHFDLPT